MKLSVIGCGYLGAVHAASMAELGHHVIGVDVDSARIELCASGKAAFHEPGIDDFLGKTKDRLTHTTETTFVG